jgi:hypothetical protein
MACAGGDATFVWKDTGHCYLRHDQPQSWAAARRTCWGEGADLVAYTAREPRAVLDGLLHARSMPRWIGLLTDDSKTFHWLTGESTQFLLWRRGEPLLTSAGGGRCVYEEEQTGVIDAFTGSNWAAAPCDRALAFTCEKTPWVFRETDGHSYRTFFRRVSWSEARDACARAAPGAHLVTVQSAEEQAFIVSQTYVEFWLGGSDREVEGRFTWIDGQPLGFRGFAVGEPDDPDGTFDCLLVGRDRGWHDRECGGAEAYVCEIEPQKH